MKQWTVVIERGPNSLSARVPDLPGSISTGKDLAEIERNIREAIELHLEGLLEDGVPAPERSTVTLEVEVPTAAEPALDIPNQTNDPNRLSPPHTPGPQQAVSRPEAISLQRTIGTITAVGSPASFDTT